MPQWRADPQAFWAEAAKAIDWIRPPRRIFDAKRRRLRPLVSRRDAATPASTRSTGMSRPGAAIGRRSIYDSPVAATKRRITYAELLDEVATLAAVLGDLGVGKGDRVIVYMPMIPEAIVAMLACARIGAIHSVVFGGFAAKELATRIDDARAQAGAHRELRHRAGAARRIQAAARSGDRPGQAQAASLRRLPAAAARGQDGRGARPRLGRARRRGARRGQARALRRTRRHRSALHPLHLGNDRRAQGRGARHRRLPASR